MRRRNWKPILLFAVSFLFFFAGVAQAAGPSITSLTPTSGAIGASVTIAGSNFGSSQGTSTVKFNGTTATVTSWSSTSIHATVPTGATTGNVVVTVSNKASNGVSFTVVPAPSITSLTPTSGAVGASVTIAGSNFGSSQGSSTVKFNGTTSTATSWSSTSISATVPAGATTGNVIVHASGVDSNGSSFTVVPAPSITSLTPTSGAVGASVTVAGSNFGSSQGSSTVKFNGTTATVTSWSSTSIGTTVPAGATTGNVVVHASGVDSNGAAFTVAPIVSSLSPTGGAPGTSVTITGSNFGGSQGMSTVIFNGTAATPTSWSTTSIVAPVPSGASSGLVVVTVQGMASNGVAFTVAPTISSLSPTSGPLGSAVTISGTNFGASQGTSTVKFGGATSNPTSWSNTAIVAPVPSAAGTGAVVVTVAGFASNGITFTVTPGITGLSPAFGPVGSNVTISGTLYGTSQGTSTVTFNGVAATPSTWGTNTVIAPVPSGATTGQLLVTVGGLTSNGVTFTVGPGVTTLNPTSGATGTSVAIAGTGFGSTQGSSTVTFNGLPASVTSWSSTSIVATVPSGASTGPVAVTVGGASSNGVQFTVPPIVTGIAPTAGPAGTSVTISGSSFGVTAGTVTFNGVAATSTNWGPSRIAASVPSSATTGPVVVSVGGFSSNTSVSFTVGTGSITGTITRASDGTAISGAFVEALQSNVSVASATTATNGTYTISNLNPGTYDVRITASGYGTTILAGNNVATGSPVTVNAALSSPGAVAGQVTQSDGITPISGATVTLSQSTDTAGTASTDSSGNYTVSNLSPGSFTLQGVATGFKTQTQSNVSVSAGNTTPVNLSLLGQSTISYDYDELGRLVGAVDSLSDAAAYRYDTVGNLLSISRNHANQTSIIDFTPKSGPVGTVVTISGTAFSSTPSQDTVNFNGTNATVTSAATMQVVVTVPASATSGTIQVTSPNGTATSASNFTVTSGSGLPSITSFSPAIATSGTAISIAGTNFDSGPYNDKLSFNITRTPVSTASSTSLSANLPMATASGKISLTTPIGFTKSSQDLFVPFLTHVAADVSYTGRTTLGSPATVSIGTTGKIGLLVFDAPAGQIVSFSLSGSTFSSCLLYLFTPTQTQILTATCANTSGPFIDTLTLSSAGTYTIGADPGTATGSVTVTPNNDADLTGTITPGGSAVTVPTTVPGQDARYTFSGTAGQRVGAQITNSTNQAAFLYLVKPDGTNQTNIGFSTGGPYFLDTQTLATTGTYQLWVRHSQANVGSETLQLYSVPPDPTATVTVNGSTATITTTVPGQNASVTFGGTSGQQVTVHITNNSIGYTTVTLKDPSGTALTSSANSGSFNLAQQTLSTTGTYTIFIDPYGANTGSLSVNVTNP